MAIIVGVLGLVVAAAVAIAIKVGPFIAAGAIGSALSGAFGGPWNQLPGDVRGQYEQRLEAAIGDRFEGMEEAEVSAAVTSLVRNGLLRLSDDLLVRRLDLQTSALHASSESVCAAFGRQSLGGLAIEGDTASAMIASLSTEELVPYVGINVEAIEAETRGTPEQTFASEADTNALFTEIFALMTPEELQALAEPARLLTTDAENCAAIRQLYDLGSSLDPTWVAIMARVDVQP